MENPFDSPREMIEGAKEHIADLETGVKAFLHQDNWTGFFEVEPHSGDYLLKLRFKTDLPRRLSLRLFDAAGYLRAALDHAAYASAVTLKGGEPKRTKFLFGRDEEDLISEIKRGRCKDMHDDIIDLIISFKPYEAGNRPLWALNELRNKTNHRVLSPAAAAGGQLGIIEGQCIGVMQPESVWRATRRELTYFRLKAGAKFNMRVNPMPRIIADPAFGLPTKAIVTVLNDLTSEVESIVMAIEAETLRIAGK